MRGLEGRWEEVRGGGRREVVVVVVVGKMVVVGDFVVVRLGIGSGWRMEERESWSLERVCSRVFILSSF